MSAIDVGLAVMAAAMGIVFTSAAVRFWRAGDQPAALALWLIGCLCAGYLGYSVALASGAPA